MILYDFAKLKDVEAYKDLKDRLNEIKGEVSILVNNVGIFKDTKFHEMHEQDIQDSISVTINSQTYMSRIMIPKLLARDATKRSAVINIASVAGLTEGNKNTPVYGPAKGYNMIFGKCLHDTYKDRIDVLTITPNTIKTNMNSGRYVFSIESDTFANSALDRLGYDYYTRGNWKHALEPYALNTPVFGWVIRYINNNRFEAFKKERDEKKAEEKLAADG